MKRCAGGGADGSQELSGVGDGGSGRDPARAYPVRDEGPDVPECDVVQHAPEDPARPRVGDAAHAETERRERDHREGLPRAMAVRLYLLVGLGAVIRLGFASLDSTVVSNSTKWNRPTRPRRQQPVEPHESPHHGRLWFHIARGTRPKPRATRRNFAGALPVLAGEPRRSGLPGGASRTRILSTACRRCAGRWEAGPASRLRRGRPLSEALSSDASPIGAELRPVASALEPDRHFLLSIAARGESAFSQWLGARRTMGR
jgi:hypothetical protein